MLRVRAVETSTTFMQNYMTAESHKLPVFFVTLAPNATPNMRLYADTLFYRGQVTPKSFCRNRFVSPGGLTFHVLKYERMDDD